MGYTLIIQHAATRQEFLITGLKDVSTTYLAYIFENFQMPADAQEGEYTGVLFWDGRDDVEYVLDDNILNTLCKTSVGDVYVRDLRPEIFLFKYGCNLPATITEPEDYYYGNNENYRYYEG